VDENGALVTRAVKDFLDTKVLGYMYDNDSNCTRTPPPKIAVAQSVGPGQAASAVQSTQTQPVRLNPTTTSVNVAIQAPKLTAGVSGQTTLVLRDVTSHSDPGALLGVFVARKDTPNTREQVGTINWFGAFDPMEGMQHDGPVARTFRFDISKALQTLGLSDARELTVTFDAISGLVASTKKAASTKILATPPAVQFRSGAELSVGAIEIQ
jgi:hypothetical protein